MTSSVEAPTSTDAFYQPRRRVLLDATMDVDIFEQASAQRGPSDVV
jgi:hypothetical protein